IDHRPVYETLRGDTIIDARVAVGGIAAPAFTAERPPAIGGRRALVDFIGKMVPAASHAPDAAKGMVAIVQPDGVACARAATDLDRPGDGVEASSERRRTEIERRRGDDAVILDLEFDMDLHRRA